MEIWYSLVCILLGLIVLPAAILLVCVLFSQRNTVGNLRCRTKVEFSEAFCEGVALMPCEDADGVPAPGQLELRSFQIPYDQIQRVELLLRPSGLAIHTPATTYTCYPEHPASCRTELLRRMLATPR